MSDQPSNRAGGKSGYRLLPHTADVMVAAWAPTMAECIAEAVRGLVAIFADVRRARPQRLIPFACDPAPETELLVDVLDEVIFLLDTEDVVPAQVALASTENGGLVGEFGVVPRSEVAAVGPVPKAVTRHELRLTRVEDRWQAQVVVDV